jgi:hypothetical protein
MEKYSMIKVVETEEVEAKQVKSTTKIKFPEVFRCPYCT